MMCCEWTLRQKGDKPPPVNVGNIKTLICAQIAEAARNVHLRKPQCQNSHGSCRDQCGDRFISEFYANVTHLVVILS